MFKPKLFLIILSAGILLLSIKNKAQNKFDSTYVIISDTSFSFIDYQEEHVVDSLISIAWKNYPRNRVFENLTYFAEEKLKQEKWSWLNTINLTAQYIPQRNNSGDENDLYPTAGIGVVINIGTIFNTPSRIKQAEFEVKIARANVDKQKNYIRAEVSRRYFYYKENLNLLKVHLQAYDDAIIIKSKLKYKFENGEVDLEEYTRALTFTNSSMENLAKTKGKVFRSKRSLEEIIGQKLERVF